MSKSYAPWIGSLSQYARSMIPLETPGFLCSNRCDPAWRWNYSLSCHQSGNNWVQRWDYSKFDRTAMRWTAQSCSRAPNSITENITSGQSSNWTSSTWFLSLQYFDGNSLSESFFVHGWAKLKIIEIESKIGNIHHTSYIIHHTSITFSKMATWSYIIFQRCQAFSWNEESNESFESRNSFLSSHALNFCF
jgi:hypothetical protein